MNKKLIAIVSVSVVAVILVLWTILRLAPICKTHNFTSDTIAIVLSLLALPMRLYVIYVTGENGHWSLPVLVLFLGLSGLMWGIIIERVAWAFFGRKRVK